MFSVQKYIHFYFVIYKNFSFIDDEKIRLDYEILGPFTDRD